MQHVTSSYKLSFAYFSLKELSSFIKATDQGLQKDVEEGDYGGLVDCMGNLIAVRDRLAATDEMFEPLKETIELLKTYNQEMPEEVSDWYKNKAAIEQ